MDNSNFLINDRENRLKTALEKYGRTIVDAKEYIEFIKNWIKCQKYIPEMPDDNLILNFLLMNKFKIQNVKEKLEMYYSVRSTLPEFFESKNPQLLHMQDIADKIYYIPLPRVTEEGYRVGIVKFVDDKPENFRVYDFFGHTYNISEVRLHEDIVVGDILIYDFDNLKVGHFLKLTPMVLRKTAVILEKVFSNRVVQIHILNSPKYAAATICLAKQVMKPKMAARIHIHKGSSSIHEYISPKILPSDYGGEESTLADLNKLWKAKLAEYNERFLALEKIRIRTKSKPISLINDEVLGFHGKFRKLEVD